MPLYHLYHMHPFSGHIEATEDFHASDDVEAVHRAQRRARKANMELWSEGRKVSRFDADPNVFQVFQTEARGGERLTGALSNASPRT